jgi:hypothetical protein
MERDKMPDSREGLLNLLQEWRGFAEWACNIHNSRQSRYAYLNFILGIPIAVLSISVGGGTIALFEESLGTTFRVLTAVFSLVAAARSLLREVERRDGPQCFDRRPRRGCKADDATGARLSVVAS